MTDGKRKRKPKTEEWMSVYTTHDYGNAHIIAGRLNSEDIETMVQGQPGASAFGFTLGSFGEINVLVSPEDYHDALDLLYPEDDIDLDDTSVEYDDE